MSEPADSDLYHDAIVAAAREATGSGRLTDPTSSATLDNPLCGDRVSIDVAVESGKVRALAHRVKGCLLCEAVSSIIGARAVGARVEDLHALRANVDRLLADEPVEDAPWWSELDMFAPVRAYRSRHECVRLPFDALVESLGPVARRHHRDSSSESKP